jgi:hypothetical protein
VLSKGSSLEDMSATKVPERKMEEVTSPRGIEPEKVSFWDYSNGKLKQVNIHPKKLNSDESFIQNFMKLHDPIVTDRTLVHVATNDDEHYHIVVLDKESTGNDNDDANDWIKKLEEKGKLGAGHIAGMVIGGSALLGVGYHVASKLALKYEVELLSIKGHVIDKNFFEVSNCYLQHKDNTYPLNAMFIAMHNKWTFMPMDFLDKDKMKFILYYALLQNINKEVPWEKLKREYLNLDESWVDADTFDRYFAVQLAWDAVVNFQGYSKDQKKSFQAKKENIRLFALQSHVVQLLAMVVNRVTDRHIALIILMFYCKTVDEIIQLLEKRKK